MQNLIFRQEAGIDERSEKLRSTKDHSAVPRNIAISAGSIIKGNISEDVNIPRTWETQNSINVPIGCV